MAAAAAAAMDASTRSAIAAVTSRRLNDFTCMAFEVELDGPDYASAASAEANNALMLSPLEQGEQILDVLRLFLFRPGEDRSIGRFGAIDRGVYGVWLGSGDGENMKFLARTLSRYQLVQPLMDVTLDDVRRIYGHQSYKQLNSAACAGSSTHDPLLRRIFLSLRALRITRDIPNLEARFRVLAPIAEYLAKRDADERLQGDDLRFRIARLAYSGQNHYGLVFDKRYANRWESEAAALAVVRDLWKNVRNSLSHSVEEVWGTDEHLLPSPAEAIGGPRRDPLRDMSNMERIVINMIHEVLFGWVCEEINGPGSAYEFLLRP